MKKKICGILALIFGLLTIGAILYPGKTSSESAKTAKQESKKTAVSVSSESAESQDMETAAREMGKEVIESLKNARKQNMPDDICKAASQYEKTDSEEISEIYMYQEIKQDVTEALQENTEEEISEEEMMEKLILIIVGRTGGADDLSFTGSFHCEKTLPKESEAEESIWVITYESGLSAAVAFCKKDGQMMAEGYPVTRENIQSFEETMGKIFEDRKEIFKGKDTKKSSLTEENHETENSEYMQVAENVITAIIYGDVELFCDTLPAGYFGEDRDDVIEDFSDGFGSSFTEAHPEYEGIEITIQASDAEEQTEERLEEIQSQYEKFEYDVADAKVVTVILKAEDEEGKITIPVVEIDGAWYCDVASFEDDMEFENDSEEDYDYSDEDTDDEFADDSLDYAEY